MILIFFLVAYKELMIESLSKACLNACIAHIRLLRLNQDCAVIFYYIRTVVPFLYIYTYTYLRE